MPMRNHRCCGKTAAGKNSGNAQEEPISDRIIQIAKEAIEREGKVHALIILEAFEGWDRRGRLGRRELHDQSRVDTSRKWRSSAMKNGKTTRLLLPPRDFVPRPSSSSFRRA